MENTPVQQKIIKTYQQLAEVKTVYPSYTVLAKKVGVSRKYAFNVIKEWRKQNKTFGLK